MIAGIGADILKIERLALLKSSGDDAFIKRVYTLKEQQQAQQRPDPLAYYAARFSAKEAVFKCLGLDGNRAKLNEIEILGTDVGAPVVTLYGDVLESARTKGIKNVTISLSYEDEYVLAFALAQTDV